MKTEYKRDMNHNYLILHGDNEIDTTSYQVRMLVGNVIPSLLKCRIQGMDGRFMVYYDITSRQSLSTFYENKKLRKEEVKLIFTAFIRVMEDTAEYLMDPGQLVISPDLIFLEADKKELYFCLMPGYQKDIREQLQTLAEYILPKINHEDEEAVGLGYGIYRRALEDSFHLENIKEELYKGRTEAKSSITGETPGLYEGEEKKISDYRIDHHQKDSDLWKDRNAGGNFVREETKKRGCSSSWGKKAGKNILAGLLFLGAAGSIITAKILGYLPQISMEMILGTVVAGIGVGMLLYLGMKKTKERKDKQNRESGADTKYEKKLKQDKKNRRMFGEERGEEWEKSGSRDENDNWDENDSWKESCSQKDNRSRNENRSRKENGREKNTENEKEELLSDKGGYFGETVVLSAVTVSGPASLVSHEPGELATIYLREDITVIGKLENACDAVIDLPTVSRIHAKIRKRDDEYYLTDLNSRNGTSVNGRLLRPDEEYKLENEDQVDFAQARYIFAGRQ